jgi:hypothetical protein
VHCPTSMRLLLTTIVLVLLLLNLAMFAFDARLEIWNDNAEFIVLAQSLATGQGYAMINEPRPVPHTRLPIGFPVFLAPFVHFAGTDLVVLKMAVVGCYIAAMLALWSLSTSWMEGESGAGLALPLFIMVMSASNWLILAFSCQVMSEIHYLAVNLFCLLGCERARRSGFAWGWVLVASLLAVWSYHIRSIGIAMVLALGLCWLIERRFKAFVAHLALSACAILPWLLWVRHQGGVSYFREMMSHDPYRPYEGMATPMALVRRTSHNFEGYLFTLLPRVLIPTAGDAAATVLAFALIGALLYGLACAWRTRRYELSVYAVLYGGVLLLWPENMCYARYLIPVVPLVMGSIAVTASALARSTKGVLSLIMLGFAVLCIPQQLAWNREIHYGFPDASFEEYFALGKWARDHLPAGAVIATRKPQLFHLTSGRRTIGINDQDLGNFMQGRLGLAREELYGKLVLRFRDQFEPVQTQGRHRLWKLRAVPGTNVRQ